MSVERVEIIRPVEHINIAFLQAFSHLPSNAGRMIDEILVFLRRELFSASRNSCVRVKIVAKH